MSDKRSRLAGLAAIEVLHGRPAKELRMTFAPARDETHWYMAVTFEKDLTVAEVCERLRGMANLLEQGEHAYGHPVLSVGPRG